MLELDRILLSYVERHYAQLDDRRVGDLLALLDIEDDRLWDWLSGRFGQSRTPAAIARKSTIKTSPKQYSRGTVAKTSDVYR